MTQIPTSTTLRLMLSMDLLTLVCEAYATARHLFPDAELVFEVQDDRLLLSIQTTKRYFSAREEMERWVAHNKARFNGYFFITVNDGS